MIPVTLDLRDFLSYRDPDPIDFTRFDVACLTGANGMGKSALLDAMTWAIFGAARGCEGGRHQERLIRDNADAARVAFTFDLADATYRVTRKRTRAGTADLRFEVQGPDGWTNLAGDTLSETESRIEDILRMDYRTFTASAFFVQGRADDFLARMRPEERKDVFARLLDLGAYDRLCDEARRRGREAKRHREELTQRITTLKPKADELDEVEKALQEATEGQRESEERLEGAEERLEELRDELGELERLEATARGEREVIVELDERITRAREELAEREEEAKALEELCARREEVEARIEELEKVKAAEAEARKAAEAVATLDRRRVELTGKVEAGRAELERRRTETAEEIERAEAQRRALAEKEKHREEIATALQEYAGLDDALDATVERITVLREEHAALLEQRRTLESRREEATERFDLLEAGEGECPVCGGALDDEHRAELLTQTRTALSEIATASKELSDRLEGVEKEGKRLREERERLEKSRAEAEKLRADAKGLEAVLERLPEVAEHVEKLRAIQTETTTALEEGAYAREERKTLEEVETRIKEIAYDATAHERLRERIEELSSAAELKGRLEVAGGRLEKLAVEREKLRDGIAEAEETRKERAAALEANTKVLEALPKLRERVEGAKKQLGEARQLASRAAEARTKLAERKASLAAVAEQLAEVRTKEQEAATEHKLYGRLAQAFGRGGIPDRIIENALPELEHEANDALGRLSDYEMSLAFKMEKETKSGKVRETFDVLVHHDGGVRDFQMFSGGEAFRVAFAIRLGLSKLLVRRAGARLETLIVDEGFGTQDPEGRERLVEAINIARREFPKILVITHLDELKDAFGAQLRVTKTVEDGSRVELLGA